MSPHPNQPATAADAELEAWVRLGLAKDIGPALARRLVETFGSAREAVDAGSADLRRLGGLGERRAAALRDPALPDRAAQEIQRARALGVALLHPGAPNYPAAFNEVPNPPVLLYVLGELAPGDLISVGVVGPRSPSDYAREMTRALVPPLCAFGVTIISGLAMGVDHEAHLAALECGGRTIGVVAQGLDQPIAPAGARKLARRILDEKKGALVGVFPFGTPPFPGAFPQRNWVIAGLSLATLVIEAGEKSGSLITAAHAADMGRPVMACPGDATRPNARGSNMLLSEGASLIQSSDDALRAMANELRRARIDLGHAASADSAPGFQAGTVRRTLRANGADPEEIDESEADPDETPAARNRRKRLEQIAARSSADPTPPPMPRAPADDLERFLFAELALERRSIDHLLDAAALAGIARGALVQKLLILEMSGVLRQLPGRIYQLVSI